MKEKMMMECSIVESVQVDRTTSEPCPPLPSRLRALTFSAISTFQRCPREYELSYVERLAPSEYAAALAVGSAFHAGVAALHLGRPLEEALAIAEDVIRKAVEQAIVAVGTVSEPTALPSMARDIAKTAAMVCGWYERYFAVWNGTAAARDRDVEMLESEVVLEAPLPSPTSRRASRSFTLAGRLDGIVRLRDRAGDAFGDGPADGIWVYEAKTTSAEITEAAESFSLSVQPSLYEVLASSYFGPHMGPVLGSVVDLVKKPVIRTRNGETPEEYRARAVAAYRDEPERYFRRLVLRADEARRREALTVHPRLRKARVRVEARPRLPRRLWPVPVREAVLARRPRRLRPEADGQCGARPGRLSRSRSRRRR
jgi:hypothetical protein